MLNVSCENKYISTLIGINRSLRDQLELMYSLMKKKIILNSNEGIYNKRFESLLSELEIVHSNLSLEMQKMISLCEIIKKVDLAVLKGEEIKELQKVNCNLKNDVDKMTNELELIKKRNSLIEQENIELKKLKEDNENQIKILIGERNRIANENEKLKEKKENEELIGKIDELTQKLSDVEKKYKSKVEQKDLIICKLDEQLQSYEKEISIKDKEIAKMKIMNKEKLIGEMIKRDYDKQSHGESENENENEQSEEEENNEKRKSF